MSLENKIPLEQSQNQNEVQESYDYNKALELTQKIHDWMDKNWYNHEQYGINQKTWVVFSADWKIKILVNEKAEPIDTWYTKTDYTTNRFWTFTVFKIAERIRELERNHKSDIENLAWTEKKEIVSSTRNSLQVFFKETIENWTLGITWLINKTKNGINSILNKKEQKDETNQVKIEEDKKLVTQNKSPQSQSNLLSWYDPRNYQWTMFWLKPETKNPQPHIKQTSATDTLKKYWNI